MWTCQLWIHIFQISGFFCGASLIASDWFVEIRDAGGAVGQNGPKCGSKLTSMNCMTTTTCP